MKEYKVLLEQVKKLVVSLGKEMKSPKEVQVFKKSGTSNYVTQMDEYLSERLTVELQKILPKSRVISEEDKEKEKILEEPIWVVDPLDGTSNYMFDFQISCISIGLLEKGVPVLGVIYNPFTKELYEGAKGWGAYLNDEKIVVGSGDRLKNSLMLAETNPYSNRLTSNTMPFLTELFSNCVDLRILGAAALDLCYLSCGRGGGWFSEKVEPWDIAAGTIILEEAGGVITDMQGNPLSFHQATGVLAGNKEIHQELLQLYQNFCKKS